ncbi:MAG: hypothetical protein JWN79_329 [Gemmatimonadetes bacterium]|jgi:hypothetical protein|nr:hypothetical protein [Gemmatimonadota bacterium]
MTPTLVRPLRLALLAAVLSGCAMRAPELSPTASSTPAAWASVLALVAQDVQAGRHAAADRRLLDFQVTHPAAPEAADAAYYRALFKLDPSNPAASTREAVALLDGLIATPIVTAPVSPRQTDALVLRRVATSLETRPVTVVTTPSASGASGSSTSAPRTDESRAKDEEIGRLKDELSKANAELERIKRRVATPKP